MATIGLLVTYTSLFQEVANIFKTKTTNIELIVSLSHLNAQYFMLHVNLGRVSGDVSAVDPEFLERLLNELESPIAPDILNSPLRQMSGSRLHEFAKKWEGMRRQEDRNASYRFAHKYLPGWTSREELDKLAMSLNTLADEVQAGCPRESSLGLLDLPTHMRIRKPSLDVCTNAQSMFEALLSCGPCDCQLSHDFGARLRLGTYRKLSAPKNRQLGHEFDIFLSMEQGQKWQHARIKAAVSNNGEAAAPSVVNANVRSQPVKDPRPVKTLCRCIEGAKSKPDFRLELEVVQHRLYPLRSTKSEYLIDIGKGPVSLEQFIRANPDSLSMKAKLILSVLLSSAVLHLCDTAWMRPAWNSSNVLFFYTRSSVSSQLPLRPFIQVPLAVQNDNTFMSKDETRQSEAEDIDSDDSEDFDPDSDMEHQLPALVTLAVTLMEIYSAKPINDLAKRYDIIFEDENIHSADRIRYINICELFRVWRTDIPENTQFTKAVDKCLDWQLWLDEKDECLQGEELREMIYREVVLPLETELSLAFRAIGVDDLDEKAAKIDFGDWDQPIQGERGEQEVHPLDPGELVGRSRSSTSTTSPGPSISHHYRRLSTRGCGSQHHEATYYSQPETPTYMGHLRSDTSHSALETQLPLHLADSQLRKAIPSTNRTLDIEEAEERLAASRRHHFRRYSSQNARSQASGTFNHTRQRSSDPINVKGLALNSPETLRKADFNSLAFFDGHIISEVASHDARSNYTKWKSEYGDVYERFIPGISKLPYPPPVKIAILDTGLDFTHPFVIGMKDDIQGTLNWLETRDHFKAMVHDMTGHGTFTGSLIKDYAPDARLYVAKVADEAPTDPQIISRAIDHAVSVWGVDIISMSFGYPTRDVKGYEDLEAALERANAKRVLLFAAASNNGGKTGRSFPAREPTVIAVHSTDTYGNRSGFSPTADSKHVSLATVGQEVESVWPLSLRNGNENAFTRHKSGTSYSTPIMAGIAAFLLSYVAAHLPDKLSAIKKRNGMEAVLCRIAEKGSSFSLRDGYHFVDLNLHPDNLFGKDKAFIDSTIKDTLDTC